MKRIIFCLFIFGLTLQTQTQAQEAEVALEEVEVLGLNYKYINAVGNSEAARPVRILEQKVATFDIRSLSVYEEEVEDYNVWFKIPEGMILAIYDDEGKVVKTTERFKDIALPLDVSNSIVEKYPGWKITGDIYLVTYNSLRNDRTKKVYKLFIEKDGKHKKVKTDEIGNFM